VVGPCHQSPMDLSFCRGDDVFLQYLGLPPLEVVIQSYLNIIYYS